MDDLTPQPAPEEMSKEQWGAIVANMLAAHPEFAAVTVQAMQTGILAALDRQLERTATVSMGLYEAMTTRPNHGKRDHDRIIEAVEASNLATSPWANKTIAKEREIKEGKAK